VRQGHLVTQGSPRDIASTLRTSAFGALSLKSFKNVVHNVFYNLFSAKGAAAC
jgi:hypothetical protein